MRYQALSPDALRFVANMDSHYDTWLAAKRTLHAGRLHWKTVHGRRYLYRVSKTGSAHSLGPHSPSTDAVMDAYQIARAAERELRKRLALDGRLYRAHRLPRITAALGCALRVLDVQHRLSEDLIVVGVSALCVYALEANSLFATDHAAQDDLGFSYERSQVDLPSLPPAPVALSELDYIHWASVIEMRRGIATDEDARPGIARGGADASIGARSYARTWLFTSTEAEWLSQGVSIRHTVCDDSNTPVRVHAPDPRWFALHRLWLADDERREETQRAAYRQQGTEVLQLVRHHMPHLKVDDAFEQQLPKPLHRVLRTWRQSESA